MKPVRFLEEAQDAFLEQISSCQERQKNLGDRFLESVAAAVAMAAAHPKLAKPKMMPNMLSSGPPSAPAEIGR